MSIFIRLLPVIFISLILYLLIYNLYPTYQETLNLAQKLNELQNKEKQLDALEQLKSSLAQNSTIRQLLANKEVLDLWIPEKAKTEEIIASLNGIYQANNMVFKGVNFQSLNESRTINSNVLPLKVITFTFQAPVDNYNLINFIDGIEKNVRIMVIKKAKLSLDGDSSFEAESYFMPSE